MNSNMNEFYNLHELKVTERFSKLRATEAVIIEKDAILENLMTAADENEREKVSLFLPLVVFIISIIFAGAATYESYYSLVSYNMSVSEAIVPAMEKVARALSPGEEVIVIMFSLAFMCMIFSVLSATAGALAYRIYNSVSMTGHRINSIV